MQHTTTLCNTPQHTATHCRPVENNVLFPYISVCIHMGRALSESVHALEYVSVHTFHTLCVCVECVCCSVLQCVAPFRTFRVCVECVCCSVLQCVAVCCSIPHITCMCGMCVLQCVAVCCTIPHIMCMCETFHTLEYVLVG